MEARAGLLRQGDVSLDDPHLGLGRPPGEAEPERHRPSRMTPSPASSGSSACSKSGRPSPASAVDDPASGRTRRRRQTRRRRTRRPRHRPCRRGRRAPAGATDGRGTDDANPAGAVARKRARPTDAGESSGGSVFGMAQTVVKPPRAAARVPLATVSAVSPPGSRRCACRSHRPGASTSPRPSMPLGGRVRRGRRCARRPPQRRGPHRSRPRVDHAGADDGEGGGRIGQEPEALMRLRRRVPARPSAPGRRSRPAGR